MPRYTIKRMMLAVALAAGLLAIYRVGGIAGLVFLGAGLMLSGMVFAILRGSRRGAAWSFAISGCSANILYFLACLNFGFGSLVVMMLASLLVVPFVLGSGLAWVHSAPDDRRPSRAASWSIVLAMGLSPFVMMFTLWPFHVAFRLSKPSLDRLADRVAAGEAVAFPVRAGFFEVVAAVRGASPREVALILDADPGGRAGFVRDPGPPSALSPLLNLNCDVPMDRPWWFQQED